MKLFTMAKKAFMVSLSTVLLAGMMAGCGDEKKEASTGNSQIQDVQKIKERGVLRVGVKNAAKGFGFQDPSSGEYTGMEIDLANKLAKQLGVKTEFTAVTAATRTGLLDSGDIDCVIATFTITPERKKSWDFTTPYYTHMVGIVSCPEHAMSSRSESVILLTVFPTRILSIRSSRTSTAPFTIIICPS